MPKLDRDGVGIHYEVHGRGPTILLTHGFAADGGMWADQIEPLAGQFQVVTWDMRGHGRTDYPHDQGAYTEAETVADMAAILDAVGAPSAVIGGMSLGGYMSLGFHVRFPERTRALVIVDAGPGYRNDQVRADWNVLAVGRAVGFETEGMPDNLGPEFRQAQHRGPEGLAKAARGMLTQHDARVIDSLPDVKVPTLIVVGEQDEPYLVGSDYMAAKIPGARKVVIPNAGHAANMDQPALFNEALLDFLTANRLEEAG